MEAATTTLADSLLDDLDDLSDVDESKISASEDVTTAAHSSRSKKDDDDDMDVENSTTPNDASSTAIGGKGSGRKLLLEDAKLQNHLLAIEKYQNDNDNNDNNNSNAPDNDDDDDDNHSYSLIVECNRHLASVAGEMSVAHGDLCAAYTPKFPELEELLVDPVQYRAAVLALGNESDLMTTLTLHDHQLKSLLTSNQILTVSVAATNTRGVRLLTEAQMARVRECCDYGARLQRVRGRLTDFVVRHMSDLAPNACALLGDPTLAATLVGLAGGLAQLSKIPACNLQVLGQTKHSASSRAGMSNVGLVAHSLASGGSGIGSTTTTIHLPHTGLLATCDLVQRCRPYLQKKALKAVAAKLALAVRCDYVNAEAGRTRTEASGLRFRAEVQTKLTKWEEPDQARVLRALPKPDLTTKKRRGGRRMRRLKERFEETELMKQANTRAFSAQTGEYGDDAMGLTLGMLDSHNNTSSSSNGGAKRPAPTKMRTANTKASRRRAVTMNNTSTTNGLASSMVFTPVQGLELINPDANRDRVREANAKWFSDNTGFMSALPKQK